MKFLTLAVASTVSTFIIGGMAVPVSQTDPSLSNLHNTPGLPYHEPDAEPTWCSGLSCPAMGKREPEVEH